MSETRSKKVDAWIKDLFSSDVKKILNAIGKIRKDGNASIIKPMLEVYFKTDNPEIKNEISDVLFTLKNEIVIPELISELTNRVQIEEQNFILSIFWNSGVLPYDHIPLLVEKAAEGDFYTALETLTIIENMEGPFDVGDLEDALFTSQMFLDENNQSEKFSIMESLHSLLTNFSELE